MNIIYFIIEIILIFLSLLFVHKKGNKSGLYLWSAVAMILSNIMVLKTVEIASLEIALGFVLYASIFIVANILVQHHGPEEVKKLIIILIISAILSYGIIYLSTWINSPDKINNNAYNYVFNTNIRPVLGNTISLITIIWFNSILYHQIRRAKNKIILSNILTSIIVTFITTTIFCGITYIGTVSAKELAILVFIRYLLILIVQIIGTIPIQITNKLK